MEKKLLMVGDKLIKMMNKNMGLTVVFGFAYTVGTIYLVNYLV